MEVTKTDVMLVAIVGILEFLLGVAFIVAGVHTKVVGLAGTGAVIIAVGIVLIELAVIGYFGVKKNK